MARSNPYTGCADFHRTTSRDHEPGLTRRQILGVGLGAGVSIYAARALPVTRMFEAAGEAHAQAPQSPILVAVFLPGGLDLLDSLVPLNQYGAYRDARGNLAQPEVTTPKLGSTGLGIHQSLTQGPSGGVKGMFDRSRIGFLPGIDYANPDLSHFHSRKFWETGLITSRSSTGWLGRWLDHNGSQDNPFQGLTSGSSLSPLLSTGGAPVAALESAKSAQLWVHGLWGKTMDATVAAWQEMAAAQPGEAPGPAVVRRTARLTRQVADTLAPYKDVAPEAQPGGEGLSLPGASAEGGYPSTPFAQRLRSLAFMLSQPLGVRLATVDAGADFDTHAGQGPKLTSLLTEISGALSAFQADLEAKGLGDRVITLVWSEFGRRVKANESGGTDHGAGGIGWVQGTRARSGVLAEYPSLTSLDDKQNLRVTVDFRQVYASLIEQWLGTDAAAVLPDAGAFARIPLIR